MLLAGAVSASPREHSSDPTIATFLYENSLRSGPTNNPERFIIMSSMLMMTAAPVVPTSKSFSRSPNSKPNDGSMERVANCKHGKGNRRNAKCLWKNRCNQTHINQANTERCYPAVTAIRSHFSCLLHFIHLVRQCQADRRHSRRCTATHNLTKTDSKLFSFLHLINSPRELALTSSENCGIK